MRKGLCVAVFTTCLLGILVESALIRVWRGQTTLRPNAKLHNPDGVEEEDAGGGGGGRVGPGGRLRKGFRPTTKRCCKIGEKVAKRKMSCDVKILQAIRSYNDMMSAKRKYVVRRRVPPHSNISDKLSNKLHKCADSHPKYLEKCCKYREQFYQSMAKCKQHTGKARRRCKQSVRKSYKFEKKRKGSKREREREREKGGQKGRKNSGAGQKGKGKGEEGKGQGGGKGKGKGKGKRKNAGGPRNSRRRSSSGQQ